MELLFSAVMRTLTDVVFLFVVSHYLTRKKMLLKFRYVISMLAFVIVLIPARFIGTHYALFLLSFFLMGMVMLKIIHGYHLSKTFLMGVIIFTIRVMLEVPFYFMIFLNLGPYTLVLVTQGAKLAITLGICRKFNLHRLFNIMQRNVLPNLLLRQMILTLAFTLLAYLVFANPGERNILFLFYFYFSILIIGLGLIPITRRLYQKSIQEMVSVHELHNALLSTGIAIRELDNVDDVVAKVDELAKGFGIDLSTVDFSNKTIDGMNGQILEFIRLKQRQRQTEIDVISNIGYYKDHQSIDLQQILHWLGTLLDNALDASVQGPIKVRLVVTRTRVILSVSNDYAGDVVQDFERLFEEGYSTKGDGRGLGLYQLKQRVSELGGRVICLEAYDEERRCHYLTIEIEFK